MTVERMTTDNEKHGLFFLNTFYGKDGQAMVRGGGPAPGYEDCTLVDLLSRAATPLGLSLDEEDPDVVGEIMYDNLQFGPMECEGVLGLLWLAAVQAVEMRGRLKMIENILGDNYDLDRLREIVEADRDGLCVVLPCKPGDILRHKGHDCEADHWNIVLTAFSKSEYTKSGKNIHLLSVQEAAEAALKGEQDGSKG